MHKDIWIIVANSTHARFFKLDGKHNLIELDALVHQESRMHEGDLVEQKSGKKLGETRFGSGFYPTNQQHPTKKLEALTFAKQVSDHIENARSNGQIKKLYLAASPNFLGMLRQAMSQSTINLVETEISKDITHLVPDEIKSYFPIGL